MIIVYIYKNKLNKVYGYKVNDHGIDIVCSAVSVLALNTVNSIEAFTNIEYICNYEQNGGFLYLEIPDIKNNNVYNNDVNLLLNSFVLGIEGIKEEYSDYIKVIYEKEG